MHGSPERDHVDSSMTVKHTHKMSKRLQVIVDDEEMREIRRAARASRMTVSAWVREALREARRRIPTGDRRRKLAALRAGTAHAFPTCDIEEMLREIERGYSSGAP